MQPTNPIKPMNKKNIVALLGALTLSALTMQAQTPAPATATPAAPAAAATPPAPPAPAYTTTFTPAVVSTYMFRGQRLGGGAFEPSVEVDAGNLAIGVWANIPLANKVPGVSDPEIDPYASYTFNINDSLSVQPGFTLYTYVNAKENNGFYEYTFEPNIAVNYTVAGIKFTPKIYYDVVLKGPTYELTLGYALPLKDQGTELDFTAQVGTYLQTDTAKNVSPEVKAWGDYDLVGVSAPFTINAASKVIVGFAYTQGSGAFTKQSGAAKAPNTLATGRCVVSLSYAYTF
jgi:uncharacterized protein (TIGR02001 family)